MFLNLVLFFFVFILCHCRDAWDMAAEICLSQLPTLLKDPNAEFQVRIVKFSWNEFLFTK